ncbi:MAG: sulfite exporter TauE/SafE family protein [Actinomycetota bacterium]|nr:sulfite exporter TauE/SafE family protein [Solirubrobacterales bacterium]MBA3862216.1 sulfite exporter TauE/SafE family protein [Solirubrobacterales bacterium]MDQ3090841.1 sulfite exporter TauE/SafE family protein [Actinomycetota bacterium]MDQ3409561.1 sulfite exporter TauE/SafE family protein [Actinomycetota bacterium]
MIVEAIAVGLLAGVASGLLGVGGGAIIVPGLVIFLGLGQIEAEATSLLAIVPIALVGAWRQRRYGNVRLGEGARLGLLAVTGAVAGAVLANVLPVRAIELAFAALLVVVALQLVRGALRTDG